MKYVFIAAAMLSVASAAEARPEFLRFGYFSCVSCHVAPSGGGALTAYGRGFAAEKLSMTTYLNAEQPLHGALGEVPEQVVLGGNYRLMQMYSEDVNARATQFFRMQADFELGVHHGPLWAVATAGFYGPDDSKAGQELQYRRHYVRYDIGDYAVLRAGRFTPRFGLMLPDHTSVVRGGMSMGQGRENHTAQAVYLSERIEASVDVFVGDEFDKTLDDRDHGFSLNAFWAAASDLRLGVHAWKSTLLDVVRTIGGISLVGKLPKGFYVMTEHDFGQTKQDASAKTGYGSTTRFGIDVVQGLNMFVKHDINKPDFKSNDATTRYTGLGTQWFPHPHFEVAGDIGVATKAKDFTYNHQGSLLLFYYF